jgi:hypothetical protein
MPTATDNCGVLTLGTMTRITLNLVAAMCQHSWCRFAYYKPIQLPTYMVTPFGKLYDHIN